MANMSAPPSATVGGGATTLSDLHKDVLSTHILTRLDGPTLASVGCVSSQLRSISSQHHLWTTICHLTWPSTATSPLLRHLIESFPGGPRAFYSLSFPLLHPTTTNTVVAVQPPQELVFAVDIHYKNNLIFSKVHETETISDWFRCSPFRVDLLDPKESVPTAIRHPNCDVACNALAADMTLSWVAIDPVGGRAVNLSSFQPVAVKRHWLSGEVQVRFATVLPRDQKRATGEHVQCGLVVTCGGSEKGEMQVREVSLQMEDMEGMYLTGKESLVILQRALIEGKRVGNERRVEEGRKRYKDYLEMKRERRERKLRNEGRMDKLCIAFGLAISVAWLKFLFL